MRTALRIALWGSGTLLSLAAAVVLFLVVAGDDFYRWALHQAVEGAIDREVHVDGSFSFDLGWQPTLSVTDVWLEDATWTGKKKMARAQSLEVQVALKPLLSGILRIPRLIVHGVEVELEQSAERQRNWDIGKPGSSISAQSLEDPIYPLFDTISLTDITVTYRDRGSGREVVLRLDRLEKLKQSIEQTPAHLIGEGSINQRPFKISAQLGTIEDAIAALAPYPLDVQLQSTNFTLKASGTVEDLPREKGLDVNLTFYSPSLSEMLQTLQIETRAFGAAQASLRLKGDLASLAAEDIDLTIAAPSSAELSIEGRIADLVHSEGVDLRFGGKLDPGSLSTLGELPPGVQATIEDITNLSLSGKATGSFERLSLQDLTLSVNHAGGAEATLRGQATAGLSGEDVALAEFSATSRVFLPDEKLLAGALNERVPPMSNLEATAELAWSGDSVELRSARLTGRALEDVKISGKGRLGRLSEEDLQFEVDADLDLEGTSSSSRPLFYLFEGFSPSKWRPIKPPSDSGQTAAEVVLQIQEELTAAGLDPGAPDGKMGPATRAAIETYQRDNNLTVDGRASEALLQHLQGKAGAPEKPAALPAAEPTFPMTEALPELGPIAATIRLFFKDQTFRFEDLNLTLGSGAMEINTSGNLGRLHDGPQGILTDIDTQARFTFPSSRLFSNQLPPYIPEFTQISGSFDVSGTENLLSLSDLKATASGPSGLHAAVTAGSTELDFEKDIDIRKLAIVLEAGWPNSQSLYDFITMELPEIDLPKEGLPELGPVHAKATLKDQGGQTGGDTYALEEIAVSAGDSDQPKLQLRGSLADLVALAGLDLLGNFDLRTALVLPQEWGTGGDDLGLLRGEFGISDSDGSLGLEHLNLEIQDTSLLTLSLTGRLDDLAAGDGFQLTADLTVPKLADLGPKLGFEAKQFKDFTYHGELSGNLESFSVEGDASLGGTRVTGHFSATRSGQRPAIKGSVSSPLVRLVDLGMVPDTRTLEELIEAAQKQPEPSSTGWVFDETPIPFEALKRVDLDLDVALKDVEGAQMEIDEVNAKVTLVDGKLSVDPLTFDFVGGQATAALHADAREDQPQVHLAFEANNIHLQKLLSQARAEVPLDGTMDVVMELTGNGGSQRELASSLNGNTELAIADGHVLTSLLTLTTMNPIRWVFSESARDGYSKMNCLVLRFNIENGLARSQALLLDTPNMLADGTGQIDLRDETLKIDVIPRAKQQRLVPVSIPFSIEGRLADPSIRVDSAQASLRTSKEILLSPLNLLGSLLPFVGNGGEGEDNPCLSLKNVPPTE